MLKCTQVKDSGYLTFATGVSARRRRSQGRYTGAKKKVLAAMFGFVDPLTPISARCARVHISLSTPSSATLRLLDFTI